MARPDILDEDWLEKRLKAEGTSLEDMDEFMRKIDLASATIAGLRDGTVDVASLPHDVDVSMLEDGVREVTKDAWKTPARFQENFKAKYEAGPVPAPDDIRQASRAAVPRRKKDGGGDGEGDGEGVIELVTPGAEEALQRERETEERRLRHERAERAREAAEKVEAEAKEAEKRERTRRGTDYGRWDRWGADGNQGADGWVGDLARAELGPGEFSDSAKQFMQEYETDLEKRNADELRRTRESDAAKEEGNTLFREGYLNSAREKYDAAVKLTPWRAHLYVNRALVHYKQGKMADCVADCTHAINLDSVHVKAFRRRAMARVQLGELHAALDDAQCAARIAPKDGSVAQQLKEVKDLIDAREAEQEAERLAARRKAAEEAAEARLASADPAVGRSGPGSAEGEDLGSLPEAFAAAIAQLGACTDALVPPEPKAGRKKVVGDFAFDRKPEEAGARDPGSGEVQAEKPPPTTGSRDPTEVASLLGNAVARALAIRKELESAGQVGTKDKGQGAGTSLTRRQLGAYLRTQGAIKHLTKLLAWCSGKASPSKVVRASAASVARCLADACYQDPQSQRTAVHEGCVTPALGILSGSALLVKIKVEDEASTEIADLCAAAAELLDVVSSSSSARAAMRGEDACRALASFVASAGAGPRAVVAPSDKERMKRTRDMLAAATSAGVAAAAAVGALRNVCYEPKARAALAGDSLAGCFPVLKTMLEFGGVFSNAQERAAGCLTNLCGDEACKTQLNDALGLPPILGAALAAAAAPDAAAASVSSLMACALNAAAGRADVGQALHRAGATRGVAFHLAALAGAVEVTAGLHQPELVKRTAGVGARLSLADPAAATDLGATSATHLCTLFSHCVLRERVALEASPGDTAEDAIAPTAEGRAALWSTACEACVRCLAAVLAKSAPAREAVAKASGACSTLLLLASRADNDPVAGNACLCVGELAAHDGALEALISLDAVTALVASLGASHARDRDSAQHQKKALAQGMATDINAGRDLAATAGGELVRKNGAIALARLARSPQGLARLRELNGLELLHKLQHGQLGR